MFPETKTREPGDLADWVQGPENPLLETWGRERQQFFTAHPCTLTIGQMPAQEYWTQFVIVEPRGNVAEKEAKSSWEAVSETGFICRPTSPFAVSGPPERLQQTVEVRCVETLPPKIVSQEEVQRSLFESLRAFQQKWDHYKRERARRIEAFESEDDGSDL